MKSKCDAEYGDVGLGSESTKKLVSVASPFKTH